jgi:hypothetical protein
VDKGAAIVDTNVDMSARKVKDIAILVMGSIEVIKELRCSLMIWQGGCVATNMSLDSVNHRLETCSEDLP